MCGILLVVIIHMQSIVKRPLEMCSRKIFCRHSETINTCFFVFFFLTSVTKFGNSVCLLVESKITGYERKGKARGFSGYDKLKALELFRRTGAWGLSLYISCVSLSKCLYHPASQIPYEVEFLVWGYWQDEIS